MAVAYGSARITLRQQLKTVAELPAIRKAGGELSE